MPSRPTIVFWGELVFDHFDESATTPEQTVLGGSATAAAIHAATLGAEVRLVTAVGDDAAGLRGQTELERRGVSSNWVARVAGTDTATVHVSLTGAEARYSRLTRFPWSRAPFAEHLHRALAGADALVFSLFLQGERVSPTLLARALSANLRPRLVGCDLNLRADVPLSELSAVVGQCDFVKLNEHEFARLRVLTGSAPEHWLIAELGVETVVETRGHAGARWYSRQASFDAPAPPTATTRGDSVGAGDAFTAALVLELLENADPRTALARCCAYASTQLAVRGALPMPHTSESNPSGSN